MNIGMYVYNTLNRLFGEKQMPQFIDRNLLNYTVMVRPSDKYRKWIRRILHCDILPYLYGTRLMLDLIIKPPKNLKDNATLIYEWQLHSSDGKTIFKPQTGNIGISPNKKHRTSLTTDLIRIPTQYELELKINNANTISQSEIVAILTVQDRDDFYRNTMIPILVGVFGVVLGAILGIVFTKLFGT